MDPFSVYLHIPFCLHKCPYCDFNTYAVSTIPEKEYAASLLAELDYRAQELKWRGRPIRTIYFGGGTPSLFGPATIERLISGIAQAFPVEGNVEISLEANPGTLDANILLGLKEAGVNRLSLGAQSFSTEVLRTLGRTHAAEHIESSVETAHAVGIKNVSLDLIFGVPGQTLDDLLQDISRALALKPLHISTYGLTIEKGTEFYQRYKQGRIKVPKEKLVIEMIEGLNKSLATASFERYEISNYALNNKVARHNLAYWNGEDYLGLGAGAHSYRATPRLECEELYGMHWANFALPNKYMREVIAHGEAVSWRDNLDRAGAIFEYFFLGLRKIAGVWSHDFEARFGQTIFDTYPALIDVLSDQGLVTFEQGNLKLTPRGLMLADSVIENFSPVERPRILAGDGQSEIGDFPRAANG